MHHTLFIPLYVGYKMKTYTLKEFVRNFGGDAKYRRTHGFWTAEMHLCSCIRYGKNGECGAYEDCTNCLGYGIMPIPLSELNR